MLITDLSIVMLNAMSRDKRSLLSNPNIALCNLGPDSEAWRAKDSPLCTPKYKHVLCEHEFLSAPVGTSGSEQII